jgi:diguanylate cyclase (GGDEF)-like protein
MNPKGSPATRVLALSGALALVAGVLYVVFLRDLGPARAVEVPLGFLVLVLLFAASEVMVVHLAARGEAFSIAFADVPLVIGLALADPTSLLIARLVGSGLTFWLYRRLPLRKLLFNLSMFAAETVVAVIVYRAVLGDASVTSLQGILATFAAVLAGGALALGAVTVAMTFFSGRPTAAVTAKAALVHLITLVVNAALGLGCVAAVVHDPWLAVPIALGAVLLYLLYRAYVIVTQRYEELEALHRFTERVTSSLDLGIATRTILQSARQLLRCEQAWLLVPQGVGTPSGPRLVRDLGTEVVERPLPGPQGPELLAALDPDHAHIVDVGRLPAWFGTSYKDMVCAPVAFDREAVGTLVVANRLTTVSTFDTKDVRLLETLANQAGIALQNGRLYDRLKSEADRRTYQALHDGLTGLPNRTQLEERFRVALDEARRSNAKVGVLVIDLEGFKDVNDTLGHQTGDEVLRQVCKRMQGQVPATGVLARFGGDEFVVMLPNVTGETDAIAVGAALLESLTAPFRNEELTIAVGARVGVALYPDHGADPQTLLQRADVAMYRAKMSASGIAVYAPEDDPFTPQRLALAGELREAIGRGEIEVLFQPVVSLKNRNVVGAEALVRWRHPQRGLLPAGAFVPIAERTGTIHTLTLHVMSVALAECRRWREHGHELSVAVNLSMQNLLDPSLPGDVVDLLVSAGLPPDALILELTESLAMTEVRRTLGILSQVHELGVRLAIDDFGTGYSSLAYLRRLPVAELKIDRSFVHSLAVDDPGAAIVATVVELGHQLGLEVVAEGVESLDALERLTAMGCDLAQGYVVSPPRTAESFWDWLARRASVDAP